MKNGLIVTIIGLSAVFLASCSGSPGDTNPSGAASVTSATSPEDVVRSYLGALQENDASAAESLTTDPYSDRDSWATDPPSIENVEVSAATEAPLTGNQAEGHAEAVKVPVTFDVRGAGVSLPDGPMSWGFLLVRDSDSEPWRIADAGNA